MQLALFQSEPLSEHVRAGKLLITGGVYSLHTGGVATVVTELAVPRNEVLPNEKTPVQANRPAQLATPKEDGRTNRVEPPTTPSPKLAATLFPTTLERAYREKLNLLVKKTVLMRDSHDRCAFDDCRSIAAGERVKLENPVVLNIMGREQLRVRYKGRVCYILAEPEAIEIIERES
jgi:hypothetical protein